MNDLELKKFAEKNNLGREDIAKILESSIHTVNSWFSGSRNIPKAKSNILLSYNVPIQSTNTSSIHDVIKDKDKIIELLERNERAYNEIKELKKMVENINTAVSFNSVALDQIKEFWSEYLKSKSNI